MTEFPIIIVVAVLLFIYGTFSKKLVSGPISPPLFFCFIGIFLSTFSFEFAENGFNTKMIRVLLELTLVITLFTDASSINLKSLLSFKSIPFRLLFIGLPLTIVFGFGLAKLIFPEINLVVVVLLALILAPTDAVLGQAVVTSKWIPEKIRQSINVESGLNDGFVLPFVLLCFFILNKESDVNAASIETKDFLIFLMKQFVFATAIGFLIGHFGSKIINTAIVKKSIEPIFLTISGMLLALAAYFFAEEVHGNGFIAAYVAGLAFRNIKSDSDVKIISEFNETITNGLNMFIFFVFGFFIVNKIYDFLDWNVVIYALLSLTIIRMLPVFIVLTGTGLTWFDKLFISWFGPRGIASILYLAMFVLQVNFKGYEKMISTIILTVLLSIFFHGISAVYLSNKYKV
jgi:NhaP-type Na+/H+ or K+/H+ antiporter